MMMGEMMAMIGDVPKKGKMRKIRRMKPYCLRTESHL